jgi:hypothetical protein
MGAWYGNVNETAKLVLPDDDSPASRRACQDDQLVKTMMGHCNWSCIRNCADLSDMYDPDLLIIEAFCSGSSSDGEM